MLSQAIVVRNGQVLMVNQWVQRGDLVWNFPGGRIEEGETPENACIREVKEETGYEVKIDKLFYTNANKFTFIATIVKGRLTLDNRNPDNADLIDVQWIPLTDHEKFDSYTAPLLKLLTK